MEASAESVHRRVATARARALARPQLSLALGENKALAALDLGGNALGPAGAKALAGGLRGHPTLRRLELGYNPLGPEGAQAVIDIVKFDLKVRREGGVGKTFDER